MINRRNFLRSASIFCSLYPLADAVTAKGVLQSRRLPVLIDADTANEVDDLFAIAWALIEPRLDIRGLTAAQWHTSPQAPNDSVRLSQEMNLDILRLMGKEQIPAVSGSNQPLVNKHRPQPSKAAELIIESAHQMSGEDKLSVVILGPCTNVASAVLIDSTIIPKISVNYLGFWHHPPTNTWNKREFNTNNDPTAVNVLLDTQGLEFNVMTASTSQNLVFSKEIVDQHLRGKGGIADYMINRWESFNRWWQKDDPEKSRWVMWDVAILEALAYPELVRKEMKETPHDNLLREIGVFTSIDAEAMEAKYWSAFDTYLSN